MDWDFEPSLRHVPTRKASASYSVFYCGRIWNRLRTIVKTEGDDSERVEIEPLPDREMSAQSPFKVTAKPVVAFKKVGVGIQLISDACSLTRYKVIWRYMGGYIVL